MATQDWEYPLAHGSDADFRGWGANLSAKLAAVGLVQTADTGQINWSTVTRPAINVYAGYEIWRYPDSSIFMKWEFGTATVASQPQIRVQVGTSSTGAGALDPTGDISDARTIMPSATTISNAGTNFRSIMSFSNGFFGFCGYLNSLTDEKRERAFFAVARTTDANAAVTNDGAVVYWRGTTSPSKAFNQPMRFFHAARDTNSDGSYGYVPNTLPASTYFVGLNFFYQAFVNWAAYPLVRPTMAICTVCTGDALGNPPFTPFKATLVGSTERTYISLGHATEGATNGGSLYCLAMLFE